jgi:hypothetical protein
LIYGDFAAIHVALDAGETIAFDDVVASAFQTTGSGTLEILGDVVVMSRTYAETRNGTMGQQVPPNLETTARGEEVLIVAPLRTGNDRVNLGISETAGGSGIVRVNGHEFAIGSYGRVQFPWTGATATIAVVSGDARVSGYLSQLDEITSDPMFIPATHWISGRTLIAPVISSEGVNGTEWRSDVWVVSPNEDTPVLLQAGTRSVEFVAGRERIFEDVLASVFDRALHLAALRVTLPRTAIAMTRIRNGGMSQFVPLLDPNGPVEQHLLFIENGDAYRTNIGIVSDAAAIAEVIVYDADGDEIARNLLATDGGVAQMPVAQRVTHGRARVRFLSGHGRAHASLIDNRTGDATFVAGQ